MNEVWLKEGSDTVYSFEPVDLPADTVRIHYQRQDQNYDPYGLWIWGDDVAAPSKDWPTGLPCSLQAKPTDMALMWTFQ